MKFKKILSLFCVTFLGLGATAVAGNDWLIDFEAAKVQATAEDRPILMNFTGSDWCPLCVSLKKEIFSQDAFKKYASEDLVLMELDFPNAQILSMKVIEQNNNLAYKYGVIDSSGMMRVPQIILVNAEGEVIAKTSYRPGGAEAYVEHIKEIVVE